LARYETTINSRCTGNEYSQDIIHSTAQSPKHFLRKQYTMHTSRAKRSLILMTQRHQLCHRKMVINLLWWQIWGIHKTALLWIFIM